MPTTCIPDTVTPETVTDDDIIRYWTLFSYDDEVVAVNIAGCEHSTEALARAVSAGIESPELAATAFTEMLASAKITEATFVELLRHSPLSDVERLALLENPHSAPHIAARWNDLSDDDQTVSLENEALPPEFIAAKWRHNLGAVMYNPATPAVTLEELADALGVARRYDGAPHEWALLNHPNAPEVWREHGAVPAAELEELNEVEPPVGEHLDVCDIGVGEMRLDAVPLIRDLTDDEVAAATSLVRGGFEGTVGELLTVARTFH